MSEKHVFILDEVLILYLQKEDGSIFVDASNFELQAKYACLQLEGWDEEVGPVALFREGDEVFISSLTVTEVEQGVPLDQIREGTEAQRRHLTWYQLLFGAQPTKLEGSGFQALVEWKLEAQGSLLVPRVTVDMNRAVETGKGEYLLLFLWKVFQKAGWYPAAETGKVRITALEGPHQGKLRVPPPEIEPRDLFNSMVAHGWRWKVDYSDASAEEEHRWFFQDFVTRIFVALMCGRPVHFEDKVYSVPIEDWGGVVSGMTVTFPDKASEAEAHGALSEMVGKVEDHIATSGRLVTIVSDDENGLVIGIKGYEQ